MSLAFLDDPASPPPPPWEAVAAEVERRRARRRSAGVAASGLAMLAFLAVVALVGWPSSPARVQVALRPEPTTTMVPATPPPLPAIVPSVELSPATGDSIAVAAGVGGASSQSSTGNSGPAACAPAALSLRTEVTAADIRQGAIVRLHLVNVSGSPCTAVTDPCFDASFTIETPQGTTESSSRACHFNGTAHVLPPGGELGSDDIWSPPSGVTPGQYVARGSWRVGDQVLTGTAAPFTL